MEIQFIKLAFKNVTRNMRRTIITGLIIVFGSVALILAGGFTEYSFWGLREGTIRGQLGHIQIFHEKYFNEEEDKPLQFGIENPVDIKKQVSAIEHVRFSMARIEFMGLISNGDKSVAFIAKGIEPEKEQKLSDFGQEFDSGKHLGESLENENEDEVILARGLAKSLKAKVGDYLTLMTTTTRGALNAADVKVVGIYNTGIPELNARAIMVTLETAQRLLVTNKVTNVVVVLDETETTDPVYSKIKAMIPTTEIKKWIDLATFYKAVVTLYNSIFTFMGVIIFIVVVLSSSNTMIMSIFERTKEIGTQMAIGTSKPRVLFSFLYEGLIIGIVAGLVGVILSFTFSFLINHSGINMPPPPGYTEGYPLRIRNVPAIYAGTFLFMVITAVVSTLFPAYKAARMKIVDALGHI